MPKNAAQEEVLSGAVRDSVSGEEWRVRVDLAAFYRLVAQHDMTDLVLGHLSARVPGTTDQFLLNPYPRLFEQITASTLVKVDAVICSTSDSITISRLTPFTAQYTKRARMLAVRRTRIQPLQ